MKSVIISLSAALLLVTGCDQQDDTKDDPMAKPEGPGVSAVAAQAMEEGATFWAVGNEPAWHLAIYPDEKLELVTDYGHRKVVTPDPGASRDGESRIYQAKTETTELRVEIRPGRCQDSMSGQVFDYQVAVESEGQQYGGCGQQLK